MVAPPRSRCGRPERGPGGVRDRACCARPDRPVFGAGHRPASAGYPGRRRRTPGSLARPEHRRDPALGAADSGSNMQSVLARSSIPGRWSHTRPEIAGLASRALPLILSVIGGSTDIIGFLGLNGLFTAHVTGNIVLIAAHIIAGERTTLSAVLAVPVFMLVVFSARLLAGRIERALAALLLVQLLALLGFLAVGAAAGPWTDADSVLGIIAGMFGVAAIAVQNSLVQIVLRIHPATAVMTHHQ